MELVAVGLRTAALTSPRGLGDPTPDFSWRLVSDDSDVVQAAYHVQVVDDRDDVVFDSGRVVSDEPFGVRYAGSPLRSATGYAWRVQVWDDDGRSGGWSEAATFETGILDPHQWRATWITGPPPTSKDDNGALYLRGQLQLPAPVRRARAYASALGWYRLVVNGVDLTGAALVPRYTPFESVVEYQAYDVTDAFHAGDNIVGIAVADGRFRGSLGLMARRRTYGNRLAGFLQVELDLTDGTSVTWTTNERWLAGTGRIRSADPVRGERVDLRVSDDDWLCAQPPARFSPAECLPPHPRRLIAEEVPRVGEFARVGATRVWRAPSGRQLVDFGQNAAGVVGIRLDGPAGSNVRLTHGEVLTPAGELDATSFKSFQRPVWSQLDEVVLDGVPSWYQPSFTIHGFRYLEVDGLAATLTVDDVEMVVLSSQLSDAGTFACSDPRITQLWRNTWWSTRSNFTDTPTDCPTRERSGWTGDIQVFAPTATGLVDCQAFLRRYLRNLALEQFPDGRVPIFIPMELSPRAGGLGRWLHGKVATSVGWGDAAVRLPWTMYRYYGDRIVLERQYPSMRAWVDHLERAARARGVRRWLSRRRVGHLERYVLDSGFHFGEWLRPGEKAPVEDFLHGASISTAYFASSAQLLADMAAVLGHDEDARRYRKLASNVRRAWQAAFIEDNGRIARDRQDDYVRALSFDLVPDELRSAAADRLVELVEAADDHLATGFLSTPMLLQVLVDTGHADVAFRLLLQDTPPSWLDQVQRGATTIWETWQGYDADGNAAESHNHYAFGAVAGWLREALVGIAPLEAGYRQIRIAPVIGGGLTWAEGSVETPFGSARSRWETDGVSGRLDVEIPTGVAANVHLPDGSEHQIGSGQRSFVWATTN